MLIQANGCMGVAEWVPPGRTPFRVGRLPCWSRARPPWTGLASGPGRADDPGLRTRGGVLAAEHAAIGARALGAVSAETSARLWAGLVRVQAGDEAAEADMDEDVRANLVGGLDLFSPRSMWWPYHVAVSQRRYGHADRGFADGMALAIEHDVEMIRQFFLCYRARELLERGQWEEAEVLATRPIPGSSAETAPAHCHGHRRAAQGSRHEPGARELLEDVHAEEKPARPVVEWILRSTTALAELAWLSGNHAQVRALLEPTLVRALERGEPWWLGEVASGCGGWARWSSAGRMAEPYRLLLSGDWWAARPRRVGSHWLPLRGGPGPNRR